MRKRSLQNSASARRCSATVIDVSSDGISSSPQIDERPTTTPLQELAHAQGLNENTDVPDAADYRSPLGEEHVKISECSLLKDMEKQLDELPSEKMQERQEQRDETKRDLNELREKIRQEMQEMQEERRQELQQMLDNRTNELRNEIHEIREEIKALVNAAEQIADNTK